LGVPFFGDASSMTTLGVAQLPPPTSDNGINLERGN
jgi:hypothetical protein